MAARLVRVLFVCMGNICRSPSAEGVFRHYVEQQAYLDFIDIDSAGTDAWHAGEPADSRMREAASRRGYQLDSIARKLEVADISRFDLIVPMDSDNLAELETLAGGARAHIRLLGSFLDEFDAGLDAPSVPDPYYGGPRGFEQVLDMIEAACPKMLQYCLSHLEQQH